MSNDQKNSALSAALETQGHYAGKPINIICDKKCEKAWGINNRPRLYRMEGGVYREVMFEEWYNEQIPDENDSCYLADDELGNAPLDPGTYEGGDAKPFHPTRHNRWCVRECERCEWGHPSEDLELPDFSKRRYNIAPHERENG